MFLLFSYLQLSERGQQTSPESSDLGALLAQAELHGEPVHLEDTGTDWAPRLHATAGAFVVILTVASFSMYSSGAPREARPISCAHTHTQRERQLAPKPLARLCVYLGELSKVGVCEQRDVSQQLVADVPAWRRHH